MWRFQWCHDAKYFKVKVTYYLFSGDLDKIIAAFAPLAGNQRSKQAPKSWPNDILVQPGGAISGRIWFVKYSTLKPNESSLRRGRLGVGTECRGASKAGKPSCLSSWSSHMKTCCFAEQSIKIDSILSVKLFHKPKPKKTVSGALWFRIRNVEW